MPSVKSKAPSGANTAEQVVRMTELMPGIHRIERDAEIVGYVVRAGLVSVALRGPVYNTAVEVGQSLDFDVATRLLLRP